MTRREPDELLSAMVGRLLDRNADQRHDIEMLKEAVMVQVVEYDELATRAARLQERLDSALGQNARLIIDNQRLREELRLAELFHRIAVKERDYERSLNMTRV